MKSHERWEERKDRQGIYLSIFLMMDSNSFIVKLGQNIPKTKGHQSNKNKGGVSKERKRKRMCARVCVCVSE